MRLLKHHGVLGQQWGVRNGPPYPIEDRILRKGTRLNSVSTNGNTKTYLKKKRLMYTYNPSNSWDSKVYKGPFAVYLKSRVYGFGFVNEHRFEVVKDLKMPTSKERIDEFISLYKKKPKMVAKDLNTVRNRLAFYGIDHNKDTDYSHLATESDYKDAYQVFNHAMENFAAFKSTSAYVKTMRKKYDAMVDDNNQGVYNETQDPIIIFNARQALRQIGPSTIVTDELIGKNFKEVQDQLKKKGKKVML